MSAGEAHLDEEVVSGLWSPEEQLGSIHHRDLLKIFYALQYFLPFVQNSAVCGQHDSAGLPAESGAPDPLFLNQTAQGLLRWAERHPISLLPQFIMGRTTVLATSFSCLNPILGSEWTLTLSVFQQLRRRWPVSVDLFATSLAHRCLTLFFSIPWNGWQAYAFPPYALIPAIL